MKNIYGKFTSPSAMCYLYIILTFTSIILPRDNTYLLKLFTVTTTLVAVTILWELKEALATKLDLSSLNWLFYTLIAIKFFISIVYLIYPDTSLLLTNDLFRRGMALIQLLYAYKLITIRSSKVKGLSIYGFAMGVSSIFLFLPGGYEVSFALSLINTYLLSEIFYEFQELCPRNLKRNVTLHHDNQLKY
ncbi:hypothetical protein [Propionigenium maris]|nr:hypothetical protein [Propionigenium maris]